MAVLSRVFARTGGGAEAYSVSVVEQLAASHEMHVFAQQIDHDWPGVRYHSVGSPGARPRWVNQLWYAWATWRATRSGFDVVHSHENTWHGNVQTIHVRPLRLNVLGGRTGLALALRWLKVALSPRLTTYVALEGLRCAARPGRRVVVASARLGEETVRAYPRARAMMEVIPPGVQLPPDGLEGRDQARAQWALLEPARVLLFVANDYARKGLDALLAALALLPPDVRLLVVGSAGPQARYVKLAQDLNLGQRVVFAGPLKDVGIAYRAADVLVHPTLEDSFGMVVLEAMAHGLPVVVSGPAWCGAASLLNDGVNALVLANPRDASTLAARLQALLDDSALASRLVAEGHALEAQNSWQAVGDQYAKLFIALTVPAKLKA